MRLRPDDMTVTFPVSDEVMCQSLKRVDERLYTIERDITGLKAAVITLHDVRGSFPRNDVRRRTR